MHRHIEVAGEDLGEVDRPHCQEPDVDDADRAGRIDGIVIGRFAIIGDERGAAIRREGHHIRQRADIGGADKEPVGHVEDNHAVVLRALCLNGDGDNAFRRDRDRIRRRAMVRDVERAGLLRFGRVGDVEDIDRAVGTVDDEQPAGHWVIGGDLGSALVEDAGFICAERLKCQRGGGQGQHEAHAGHDRQRPV